MFTSAAEVSVVENTRNSFYVATATDADAEDVLSYSLTGVDAAQFVLDETTGALKFVTPPDYDAPTDMGADNQYELTLSADDGNGGVATLNVVVTVANATNPELAIVFPTPNANVSAGVNVATTVMVRVDNQEDDVPLISEVHANDVALSPSDEDENLWVGQVEVAAGVSELEITAMTSAGETLSVSQALTNTRSGRAGSGTAFTHARGLDLDAQAGALYYTDPLKGLLGKIDLSNGNRSTIYQADAINQGSLELYWKVALDTASHTAYVAEDTVKAEGTKRIVLSKINLMNGMRSVISDTDMRIGVPTLSARGLEVDIENEAAYLLDFANSDTRQALKVNLAATDTGRVSSTQEGTIAANAVLNPVLDSKSFVLDKTNDRLLVARTYASAASGSKTGTGFGSLIAIDLSTGDQSLVARFENDGKRITFPSALALNAAATGAYIVDAERLWWLDLATNEIQLVSSSSVYPEYLGSGPNMSGTWSVAIDAANQVAYMASGTNGVVAVSLLTGDRVKVSH